MRAITLLILWPALPLGTSPLLAQTAPPRPNVLLIVADDQGYADLSCIGLNEDAHTPNLDRLAASGVRFTQAYATSPICSASRAALMTGVYQQRMGIRWYGGKGIHDDRYPTLAELFGAAGYATGYVGKFHYGNGQAHRPGSRSFPLDHGFDEFFGCSGGRKHYLIHNAAAEEAFRAARREHGRKGQSLRLEGLWDGREQRDMEGFSTELFGARAVRFLEEHREEPFLLTVAFNAVHNFTHQLPDAYLDEHDLRAPGYGDWDPEQESYRTWYERGRFPHNPKGRGQYLGQLHYLDREVGRLLDALDRLALSERTIVLYIGDNGGSTPIYADNGPLRGSKYTLYEGGLRVPLLLRAPGITRAATVEEGVVSALDVLPTLATLTQTSPPATLDGIDLVPLLRGEPGALEQRVLHWDTGREQASRVGNWKWHRVVERAHADSEMVELEVGTFWTDLAADPGEARSSSSTDPARETRFEAHWQAWETRIGS